MLKLRPSPIVGSRTIVSGWRSYPGDLAPRRHRCAATTVQQREAKLAGMSSEDKLKLISDSIRVVPDFPKPGIQFQDVTTILLNPEAFQATTDLLKEHCAGLNIDVIAGVIGLIASLLL